VTLFCAFHVFIDPRGAISRSEAMPGFLAGGFFSFIFLVVMVIGIVLAKKPAAAPPVAVAGGAVGAAASVAAGAAGAAQGVGAAPAKPFPAHLLVGCGTVAIALMSCSSCSSGAYFYDKANTYDRLSSYGSSYSSYGYRSGSSFMDYYYQAKARRYRTYGGVSIGLGFLLLLGTVGLGIGTAVAAKRHKAKLGAANEPKV